LGDLRAARLPLQPLVQPPPLASRFGAGVLAADVLVPEVLELLGAARQRGVVVVDRLGGARAVVVCLEPGGGLRAVADDPAAREHRAERARVGVGHPNPPDDLAVFLQQRQQAPAAAGEYSLCRGAGGLDEAVVA